MMLKYILISYEKLSIVPAEVWRAGSHMLNAPARSVLLSRDQLCVIVATVTLASEHNMLWPSTSNLSLVWWSPSLATHGYMVLDSGDAGVV